MTATPGFCCCLESSTAVWDGWQVAEYSNLCYMYKCKSKYYQYLLQYRWYVDMWWDIMVTGLILLVFRLYILEKGERWGTSKENCSSDATSVDVCESNKDFSENTIAREFILEWVNNRAAASLSLLNTLGSVDMDRYKWLSNTFACHYMHTFTASHKLCKSIGTIRMTQLLVQQPKILAESMCKSMVSVENEWQ